MFRPLILASLLLCCAGPVVAQTTVPVNVRAAYLHVDTADLADAAVPIGLADLGLAPGQTIKIESVGDWNAGPGGDVQVTMLAVFSGSSTLLAPSLLHRVPDAIDAGTDISTCCTWPNNESMEIAEDFGFDNLGVTIGIPSGATHLFVSVRDNYLRDNSDPDGDCGAKITLVSTTDVSPVEPRYVLSAYPNPFRLDTSIAFHLQHDTAMRIAIYDVTGQLVRTLVAGSLPAGSQLVRWDGRDSHGRRATAGNYLALVADGERHETVRLTLIQ